MTPPALGCNDETLKGLEGLALLFDQDPVYVSDSAAVRRSITDLGATVVSIDDLVAGQCGILQHVVMIATDAQTMPAIGSFEDQLKSAAVLVVPLMSFDGSPEASSYCLDRLSATDFVATTQRNRRWMSLLEEASGDLALSGPGSRAKVKLTDSITVMSPKLEPHIALGEWTSVAQFLEVGLVPSRAEVAKGVSLRSPSFQLSGWLQVDGCVVAHHRHNLREAQPKARAAWEFIRRVVGADTPMTVELVDSSVEQILTANGRDIFPDLKQFVDNPGGANLAEFAFASDVFSEHIDWGVNSQMNEAAGGVHVAVGQGIRGAHIDLVCSRVEVTAST